MTLLLFLFLSPSLLVSEEVTFDEANKFYEQKNYEKAFSLLKELENSKDPRVYHLLGELYYYGDHVDENDEEAVHFYGLAADLDFAPSITRLGVMHEEGNFYEVNVQLANEFYFRAHELNDDEATYFLALNMQFGAGIEQNIPRAISFYEEAVRRGNESAVIDLGYLYVNGEFITPDYEKGFNLFKTLDNEGVPDALHNLALMYANGYYVNVSIDTAFDYYERAHLKGWAPSTYEIGNLYYNGYVDGEVDYKNAAYFYQLAADLDYPPAIYSLGWMYQWGEGREENSERALELYILAADMDDPPALNQLGLIYSNPENNEFDIKKGRMYFEKAYELGDWSAPLNLARSYNYYVNYVELNDALNLKHENIEKDILIARQWYKKALELQNYDGIPEYASTFSNVGDFATARNIILQGLDFAEQNDPYYLNTKTHLFSYLAHYYDEQGFHDEALRIMNLAVEIVEQNLDQFSPYSAAMTYRDFAAVLNINGRASEALEYYEKSENLLRSNDALELLANTLNGKAIVLEELGNYDDAINNYKMALALLEDFDADTHDEIGMINANIVHSLLAINEFDEALLHAEKAFEIAAAINKGNPWQIRIASDLARVYEKKRDFEAADELFSSVEKLFSKRYFPDRPSDIGLFEFNEYQRHIHSINWSSEYFYNRYKLTNDAKFLSKAFYNYQKTRLTNAEFEMARLSARVFTNSNVTSQNLKQLQEYSDELDDIEWSLLQSQIFDETEIETTSELQDRLEKLNSNRNELIKELDSKQNGSSYQFGDRFLTVKDVQELLSDKQLLVFPAETFIDSPVTVFFVSNNKIATISTSMEASEIRDAGIQLRSSLQFSGSTSLNDLPAFDLELSYSIYNEIFSDVMNQFKDITDLIVVPSWPISNLPLAVLVSEDPSRTNLAYEDQAWLGLEKNISYVPSVSDLRLAKKNRTETLLSSFAGFGNPVLGPKTNNLRGIEFVELQDNEISKFYNFDKLPSLPATEKEVLAVADVFPDGSSNVFLKNDANEENLRNTDLSKINVLLFATHGIIAGEWELLDEPALVLTPTQIEGSDDIDGLLTASEIRELSLDADFVVLSACNTAAGDESGEGLSGLASAFIFAGAKSIMVSHWSVESDSTQLLITNFFQNLKKVNGTSGPEALRNSMQQLFEIPDYNHPIFWAPFILVGQT